MRTSNWSVLLISAALVFTALSGAHAQPVYNTDYVTFKGEGTILDNPPSATCQGIGFNFGTRFTVTYRFTANPTLVADAITFMTESHSIYRIVSTQAPNFSLNGANTTDWRLVNRFSNASNGTSSATLTIASGINGPVGLGTGNMKITNGQINDFYIAGCTINNFRAAMVVIPN
jgi:hypothetical protein